LQVRDLRIGLVLTPRAPAGIRLAREQELREALGAAEGVTVLEQRQDRCRLELRGAVHQRMVTRGEDRELAICVRNLEPPAERLEQRPASAPQARSVSKNTSGRDSPSARSVSCQARSATRAPASPASVMRRMSCRVSSATRKPSPA